MNIYSKILPSTYVDSLRLMRLSSSISQLPEVEDAAVIMGTEANLKLLQEIGLLSTDLDNVKPDDLVIVIKSSNKQAATAALEEANNSIFAKDSHPNTIKNNKQNQYYSIEQAKKLLPDANLAVISVPGKYAATEAEKALGLGMNVLLFSDNVSIDEEIKLKNFAARKGLIVMGPDCGTSIIGGVGLCFANKVRKGPIGIVGAAGTGIQELSILIENLGSGISQAFGTGGRDLSAKVGGLSMLKGIEILEADPTTSVIVILGKAADEEVFKRIIRSAEQSSKTFIANFIGVKPELKDQSKVMMASSIELAAAMAVELSNNHSFGTKQQRNGAFELFQGLHADQFAISDNLKELLREQLSRLTSQQRHFCGMYCGGTLAVESVSLLKDTSEISANFQFPGVNGYENQILPTGNLIIDFGADEFTQGRAHPMIDPLIRNKAFEFILKRDDIAIIFFDVILGYGSHPEPCADIVKYLESSNKNIIVLAHICGTESDRQQLSRQKALLAEVGVITLESNAQMARAVNWIMSELKNGGKNHG